MVLHLHLDFGNKLLLSSELGLDGRNLKVGIDELLLELLHLSRQLLDLFVFILHNLVLFKLDLLVFVL